MSWASTQRQAEFRLGLVIGLAVVAVFVSQVEEMYNREKVQHRSTMG